jgi:exodeoxyribonuclease VII small subunit
MTDVTPMTDAELAERPFDELVTELQRIVAALESGSAGLEASIALYRQGLRLHAACEERLRRAELAIADLGRRSGADGGDAVVGETADSAGEAADFARAERRDTPG